MRVAALSVLLATTAIAAAPALPGRAAAISPCKLVTAAEAKATLGGAVSKPKAQQLGLFSSCTYTTRAMPMATLTVQTRSVPKAVFVQSAKANPAPVKPVSGVGALAYSSAGSVLLVWKGGTEATFLVFGSGKGLADEVKLAKSVVGRL